jgi:hypothetical protein
MMMNRRRFFLLIGLLSMAFAAHDVYAQDDVIRNLEVKASDRNVAIGFTSFRNVIPIIEIGEKPPVFVDGRYSFRGEARARGFQVTGPNRAQGQYILDLALSAPNVKFSPSRTYHFVIRVKNPNNARSHEVASSFTTSSQTMSARILFDRIYIRDDGDNIGCGDFMFKFFVNDRLAEKTLGGKNNYLTMCTNESYNLNTEIYLREAPDMMTIHVNGLENDTSDSTDLSSKIERPRTDHGGLDGIYSSNYAQVVTHLSLSPGDSAVDDFKLVTGGPNDYPQFNIDGRILIKRGPAPGVVAKVGMPPPAPPDLTPAPGSGRVIGPALDVDFTGAWTTTNSNGVVYAMTLAQDRVGKVTGRYSSGSGSGTINGEVSGRRFSGQWTPAGGSGGRVTFEMAGDNNSFSGLWTEGSALPTPDGARGTWNGTRMDTAGGGAPPAPGVNFTGNWVINGVLQLSLNQDASGRVTGSYTGGNTLTGQVSGRRLSGRWASEDGAWGSLLMEMAADNNSFTGHLTYRLTRPSPQTAVETWRVIRKP